MAAAAGPEPHQATAPPPRSVRSSACATSLTPTRERLEAVIADKEAVNEELRAANEEMLSSGEEMQSVNEELETTHEELQSTNQELRARNDELGLVGDDLSNLLVERELPHHHGRPRLAHPSLHACRGGRAQCDPRRCRATDHRPAPARRSSRPGGAAGRGDRDGGAARARPARRAGALVSRCRHGPTRLPTTASMARS